MSRHHQWWCCLFFALLPMLLLHLLLIPLLRLPLRGITAAGDADGHIPTYCVLPRKYMIACLFIVHVWYLPV